MALLPQDVIEEVLRFYGEDELARVKGMIGSSTLAAAAHLVVHPELGRAEILIPHYWAVYYHDGRDAFSAPGGRFLIFFADPEDDPRLESGYPVRASDIRHLTRDEYYAGLERNKQHAEEGRAPFMYVLRSVGPAGGHPFFEQLSEGAAERMDQIAFAALDAHVQEVVDDEGSARGRASLRL